MAASFTVAGVRARGRAAGNARRSASEVRESCNRQMQAKVQRGGRCCIPSGGGRRAQFQEIAPKTPVRGDRGMGFASYDVQRVSALRRMSCEGAGRDREGRELAPRGAERLSRGGGAYWEDFATARAQGRWALEAYRRLPPSTRGRRSADLQRALLVAIQERSDRLTAIRSSGGILEKQFAKHPSTGRRALLIMPRRAAIAQKGLRGAKRLRSIARTRARPAHASHIFTARRLAGLHHDHRRSAEVALKGKEAMTPARLTTWLRAAAARGATGGRARA